MRWSSDQRPEYFSFIRIRGKLQPVKIAFPTAATEIPSLQVSQETTRDTRPLSLAIPISWQKRNPWKQVNSPPTCDRQRTAVIAVVRPVHQLNDVPPARSRVGKTICSKLFDKSRSLSGWIFTRRMQITQRFSNDKMRFYSNFFHTSTRNIFF